MNVKDKPTYAQARVPIATWSGKWKDAYISCEVKGMLCIRTDSDCIYCDIQDALDALQALKEVHPEQFPIQAQNNAKHGKKLCTQNITN